MANDIDLPVIISIIGVISGLVVVLTTVYFKRGDKKDKGVTDRRALEIEVERTAGAKGVIERATAKELKESAEKIAEDVKTETMRAVDQLFATLHAKTELDNARVASAKTIHDAEIASEMKARDVVINQNKKDFDRFLNETFSEFRRSINASLDKQDTIIKLIQSTLYGPEAHSFPSYIYGEVASEEEATKPMVGVFKKQSEESKQRQTEENEERLRQDEDSGY
jgi:hypothetical protein